MDSFKKLKLFPDKWYKKYSKRDIAQSRQRLATYAISKELDQGILEVSEFPFLAVLTAWSQQPGEGRF
jgi:hypothetical protein